LLDSIFDSIESVHQEGSLPTALNFQRPKANELLNLSRDDLLRAGVVTEAEADIFLGRVFRDGPQAFQGRMLFGLEIRINGFGSEFTVG